MPRSAAMSGAFTSFTASSTRPWNAPFRAATVRIRVSWSESGPCAATRHARRPRAGECHREPAELRRERDERAEHLELALVDDRDVDRRPNGLAVERRRDLLGDDDAGAILRLGRRAREVRRDDHLRELEQRAGVRLRLEDVERGARDLPRANRLGERLLVDEPATGSVHDADAVLHLRERLGVRGARASRRSAEGEA